MNLFRVVFLSLLSGLLFSASWPVEGRPILLFIAWVPLLLLENNYRNARPANSLLKVFGVSYFSFFIWNLLTTWWVCLASFGGGTMAIIANSFLMAFAFSVFHFLNKKSSGKFSSFIFISVWLIFEFLHLRWDLSWPWLTLGNAFAGNAPWIQWYEYTGVFGGSLWVLLINSMLSSAIHFFLNGHAQKQLLSRYLIPIAALFLLPLILSLWMYETYEEKNNPAEVLALQPNIDPYNEKFSGSSEDHLRRMLAQANVKCDSDLQWLILPETALTDDIWEEELNQCPGIQLLDSFSRMHKNLNIVAGATTRKYYPQSERPTSTARRFTQQEGWYDCFNTALYVCAGKPVALYHKSKLVPGVEKMPYPFLMRPLEKLAINLGGTTGSLGSQEERTVFEGGNNSLKAAPVICYESIYGEFVSDYVQNGATAIFIITNDGWWGDTPGYHQHLEYARLRAIESRRCIARSANTGISCLIRQNGDVENATSWWNAAIVRGKINANEKITFYSSHGDYIGLAAIACLCLISCLVLFLRMRL